jgi:pentose-5-phosphate-3-epimerase
MAVGVDGGVREDNLSDVLAAGATDVDIGRRLFPSRHPPARRPE